MTTSGPSSGFAFVVQVNTGTTAAPTWTTVAGQRGGKLNRKMKEIDVTSKDSLEWMEHVAGLRDWAIDFDGLLVEGDTGYAALETAYTNNTVVQVQLLTAAGNKYTGNAFLTDFPIDAPYDKEATYTGTLTGSGALTQTAGP